MKDETVFNNFRKINFLWAVAHLKIVLILQLYIIDTNV